MMSWINAKMLKLLVIVFAVLYLETATCQREFRNEIIFDVTNLINKNFQLGEDGKRIFSEIPENSTIFFSTTEPLNLWIHNSLPKLAGLMNIYSLSKLIVAFEFEHGFSEIHDLTGGIPEKTRNSFEFTTTLRKLQGVVVSTTEKDCSKNFQGKNIAPNQALTDTLRIFFLDNLSAPWIKIMFGYTTALIGCRNILEQFASADVTIVTLEFDTSLQGDFANSYGLFKSHLLSISSQNHDFLVKDKPKADVIFRLKVPPSLTQDDIQLQQENSLLGFFTRWSFETSSSVISPVPNSSSAPKLNERIPWVVPIYGKVLRECKEERVSAIKEISSTFSSVFLDTETWECLASKILKRENNPLSQFFSGNSFADKSPDVKVFLDIDLYWRESPIWFIDEYIIPQRILPGLKIKGIIFPKYFQFRSNQYDIEVEHCSGSYYYKILKEYSAHVPIGIIYPASDINAFFSYPNVDRFIYKMCASLTTFGKFLLLEFVVDLNVSEYYKSPYEFFLNTVLKKLSSLLELKSRIVQQYPELSIYLIFTPVATPEIQADIQGGIYCGKNLSQFEYLLEAVMSWGKLAQFPVILNQITEFKANRTKPSWLRPLAPFANEDWTTGGFYSLQNLEVLGKSNGESCISQTETLPENGISFGNEYFGALVNLRRGGISQHGSQLMLSLAQHKFQSLEIIAPMEDSNLKSILSFEHPNSIVVDLMINSSSRIPLNSQFQNIQKVVKYVSVGKTNFTGVHISGWEDFRSKSNFKENLSQLKKFAKANHKTEVGLTIEHCGDEAYRLVSENETTYLEKVSYIVCNTNRIIAGNEDKANMTSFLDKQLLTVKILKRRAPHLKVFFRLNLFLQNEQNGSEAYLRFVNDVNTFANIYHINYFLSAFDNPIGKEIGWWKIGNVEDLSNPSVYVEREAEYFKRETWRPSLSPNKQDIENVPEDKPFSEDEEPEPDSSSVFIYVGLGILFLLIVLSIVLFGLRYRKKFRILSNMEVQKFYNGDFELSFSLLLAGATYKARKFVKAFELPKQEFNLSETNIIREGKFTTIHNNFIRDRPVVVKVSKLGCGKATFLSMLSEVKMLCSVGCHPNVVEFVGAYTLEIHKGILYIVTEFCEMGSLLLYLKKLKENENGKEIKNVFKVNTMELIRFSEEIAAGMEYIGLQDIFHGNLSSQNVLLTKNKTCKIVNFGVSRKLLDDVSSKKSQDPFQWQWMAYESLTLEEFTTMSDVWSYGVTIWEVFSLGDHPYSSIRWNEEFEENLRKGLRLEMPRQATKEIFQIVKTCWTIEPALRPKFEELKVNFASMRDEEYLSI